MNKKKLIAIGGSILLLIGLVAVILTNRSTTSAPNILGAWYSTGAEAETLTFYDNNTCTSSIHFTAGTYDFPDNTHVEVKSSDGTYTLALTLEIDEDDTVTALTNDDLRFIRDQQEATQTAERKYATEYATYNAEEAFPKILQADTWSYADGKNSETLSFEPTQVTLSWKDDSGEHTYTWYWSYLSVKAEQDGKPIEIKLKLTAADETPFSMDRTTGMIYLYTDGDDGFSVTSDLFPSASGQPNEGTQLKWQQARNDKTLAAADDSSKEGEITTISPEGYTDGSYAATDDPFSDTFVEPKPGDIDPATNKKIQTYVRTIVGDTCTITIVYADGTKSTETINKDIQVSPEKIDVNYGE